jgi:hypothetical protein
MTMNRLAVGILGALGALAVAAAPASAGGVRVTIGGGWGSHGSGSSKSCSVCDGVYAGTLTIDGCRVTLLAGQDLNGQIVRAFERLGYRASCGRGGVVVHFGHRRPRVSWSGRGYSARFGWEHRRLVIRTGREPCDSCRDHRPSRPGVRVRVRDHDGWGRNTCPPRRRPGCR